MALSVIGVSLSLLCSATTKVLWNLWRTPACWRHLSKIEETIVIKKDQSCYVCFHVSPLTFIFTGIIITSIQSRSKCASYYNPNKGLKRKHTHMLMCLYFLLIYFLTPMSLITSDSCSRELIKQPRKINRQTACESRIIPASSGHKCTLPLYKGHSSNHVVMSNMHKEATYAGNNRKNTITHGTPCIPADALMTF